MDTTDQMVVKCASILGVSFTQTLLCNVLPKVSTGRLGSSIRRLMNQFIFVCDQRRQMVGPSMSSSDESAELTECTCKEMLPKNAPDTDVYCQWLRFVSSTVQETAYEMFVENTRQHLHRSAALYYEQQAHRCQACGGGNFLSDANLEPNTSSTNMHADEEQQRNMQMSSFIRSRHFPRNSKCWDESLKRYNF